jgi:hypothetical protein
VPEVVLADPISELPVLDSTPPPSTGIVPEELITPEPEAESLQLVQEPATTQGETKEVNEQPDVDPMKSDPEVTDGVSLVQFDSGSEAQSERPGWLIFALAMALAAALVAGVIGYRLIGK